MPLINKVERERNIKQVSRLEDLQPAKVIPKVQNKAPIKVNQKESIADDAPTAVFKAAQKASLSAIRTAKSLTESSDKTEDQEAIDKIESTSRNAVYDTHDVVAGVKESVKRQIRKKQPDIKNTKRIKISNKSIGKVEPAVKSSAESTKLAVKSTIEASKQAAIVSQKVATATLHIKVDHITAQQGAEALYFNAEQMAELNELLDPKNASLWLELLRGIGLGSSELVNLALSQLGNEGGEKYWRWAGLDERCEWCALFVSWCGDQTALCCTGTPAARCT